MKRLTRTETIVIEEERRLRVIMKMMIAMTSVNMGRVDGRKKRICF